MQAIEFIADAEDGIIKVPQQYQKYLKKQLRVIILIKDEKKKIKAFPKEGLTTLKIKTKGLSFFH